MKRKVAMVKTSSILVEGFPDLHIHLLKSQLKAFEKEETAKTHIQQILLLFRRNEIVYEMLWGHRLWLG